MRFFVYHNSPDQEERAQELAKELKLNFFRNLDNQKVKSFSEDYFLICSKDRLFLRKGLRQNARPIFSDFDDWSRNYDDRLLKNSLKGLPINFSCLDATAGFGKDAIEISKLKNCKNLVLLEKQAWVFKLLEDGIKNATSNKALELLKKFIIYNQDNLDFLQSQKINFDLIYIDPMFSGVHRAKAKKHMQAIRDLSPTIDTLGLLETCLSFAKFKVVVKRHKNMEYLEGLKPTRSLEGKVVRYDIYNTN